MANQQLPSPSTAARPWKDPQERNYTVFLDQLSAKDRARLAKNEENSEAHGKKGYGELWKRLASIIAGLAPYATQFMGNDAVKFHIPDGKYKQQVFALVQTSNDTVIVFMPDVIDSAVARKILVRGGSVSHFQIAGAKNEELELQLITADTQDQPACKSMLGWGRRAISAELNDHGADSQVRVVEQLCKLAAEKWANLASAPPQN